MTSGAYDMPRDRLNDEGGRANRAANRMSGGSSGSGNNNNNASSQDYYYTGQQQQQQQQQQQYQQQQQQQHQGTNDGHGKSSPSGHLRCKDKDCRNFVTWRNIDNIGGIVSEMTHSSSSSNNLNNKGALAPFYANQEAREVQMKLLDIMTATGLAQADIPALGGRPLAFAMLPPVGAPQQRLHSSAAWACAQYDAERDRREWFFHQRNPHLPYWRSEYCEEHTCRYFFTKEMCSTKKPKHDALCNTHAFCGVSLCREIKGQLANFNNNSEKSKSMFLRHEFCPKHKCEVDSCELLRDEVRPGQTGKFCPRHRCYYVSCTKLALVGRGYCVEHGCQTPDCAKIAVANFMLCKKHLECAERGCGHPRFVVPRDRVLDEKDHTECYIDRYDRDLFHAYYLAYCKDHGLCAEKSCSKLRIKDSVHCRKHACLERGCSKPCLSNLKYCVHHKCNMNACMGPKGWKQDAKTREAFCFNHLCHETDCSESVESLHIYCVLHECQEEPTCIAKVADGGACIQHFQKKNKKITKAAVRRDTEHIKMANQRETQQWASTFGMSVGGGSAYGGDRHPLRYFQSSNHSMRSNHSMSHHSSASRRGSPPGRRWNGNHDYDGGDYDEDYGRDRRGGDDRRRHRNGGGGGGGFRPHTPASSDAGRSRYRGDDNNDDEDDEEGDSDGYIPMSQSKQQASTNPAFAVPRSQHAPGVARPTPQNAARPPAANAASNGPNYVLSNRPPVGNSGNEPIIHQRQYGGDGN